MRVVALDQELGQESRVGVRGDAEAEVEPELVEAVGQVGHQGADLGGRRGGGGLVDPQRLQRADPRAADHACGVDQHRRRDAEGVLDGRGPAGDQRHAAAVRHHGLAGIVERRGPADIERGARVRGHRAAEDHREDIGGDRAGLLVLLEEPPGERAAREDALMDVLPEPRRAGVRGDAARAGRDPVKQADAVNAHRRPPAPGAVEELGELGGGFHATKLDVEQEEPVAARRRGDRGGHPGDTRFRLPAVEAELPGADADRLRYPRQQARSGVNVRSESPQVEPARERMR
jgi:hypothetical protein